MTDMTVEEYGKIERLEDWRGKGHTITAIDHGATPGGLVVCHKEAGRTNSKPTELPAHTGSIYLFHII